MNVGIQANPLPRRSWVESANHPECGFPIQNLPYGVFRSRDRSSIGVAIGDQILDLGACAAAGILDTLSANIVAACTADVLNPLMALGLVSWAQLRQHLTLLLTGESLPRPEHLVPMSAAEMLLPVCIGDYTDFYASIHHATRVGKLFRPECPLLPNYKHLPIGYHGRASSIVPSGTAIRRPCGQTRTASGQPFVGPTQQLDFELEVGFLIGTGNSLGETIPIDTAEQHIFGLCLVNDWSARDIQSWEYQPLGPFLGKSFATSISPWVVPLAALEPFRVPADPRPEGDPEPLPYLASPAIHRDAFDLTLEVLVGAQAVSASNLRDLYWTLPQMVAHHTSNGCNLRPGDLLATGTVSGPHAGSEGCLLEKPVLPGEVRKFLSDGDTVTLRAYARREGLPIIGFGECVGSVMAAASHAE